MKRFFRRTAAMVALCCGLVAPAWAQLTIPFGGSLDVPAGTLDVGCLSVQVEGGLNIVAGQFATASNLTIAGTGVFNGGAGVLTVGGDLSNSGTFNAGTGTVALVDGCTGNTSQLSGTMVFQNLTLTSTTGRTFVIPAGSNITVLGTLTLQGAPGQNIQLVSSGGGTAVINLGPGAVANIAFADVANDVQIGAAPPLAVPSVPTLNEYGLLLMAWLMGMGALWMHHRAPPAMGRTADTRTPLRQRLRASHTRNRIHRPPAARPPDF